MACLCYCEVSVREGNRNAGMLGASLRPADHSPIKEWISPLIDWAYELA